MSQFNPQAINAADNILSSPLRNNFNALQTLLNGGLGQDQFADGVLPMTKLTGYIAPTSWVPTYGGFSTPPTVQSALYWQIGKTGFIWIRNSGNGTSNSTSFSITNLPLTPATGSGSGIDYPVMSAVDNGSGVNTAMAQLAAGATTINFFKDQNFGALTSTATGKGFEFLLCIFPVN